MPLIYSLHVCDEQEYNKKTCRVMTVMNVLCMPSISFSLALVHLNKKICIQIKREKFLFSQFSGNLGRRQRRRRQRNLEWKI